MSRVTHDTECNSCGYQGKVIDDCLLCPKCFESIEGRAITGEELEALFIKVNLKRTVNKIEGEVPYSQNKERGG